MRRDIRKWSPPGGGEAERGKIDDVVVMNRIKNSCFGFSIDVGSHEIV